MEIYKTSNRVPVVWDRKPLMPTKWKKAKRLVKLGKAKFKYSKDGIMYLKLKFQPSGVEVQSIQLSLDPGSHFDAISVVSKTDHHENIELYHNKSVSERMSKRSGYRRVRRSRLRHRKIRFDTRNSEKLVPTIRSMVEFRKFVISELLNLYPISRIIIEDVGYQHWGDTTGKGRGFSQAEIGKSKLYKWVRFLGIKLITVRGYITKRVREKFLGPGCKTYNKGDGSFSSQCIDSFALATIGLNFVGNLTLQIRHVRKVWYNRRELTRTRKLTGDRKYYFRYEKCGVKEFFTKLGRSNICRVKSEGIHSNHPKEWIKIDNGRDEKFKYNQPRPYGGTIVQGQSRLPIPRGLSKRVIWSGDSWDVNSGKILGYRNREYWLTYA